MAQTVLYGELESEVGGAAADRDRLWIPLDELDAATGWTAKPSLVVDPTGPAVWPEPEGLCRGERCVPVPAARRADWLDGDRVDFAAFAAYLGHAVARDEARGVWAFGPAAGGAPDGAGPVLAPDFTLPDLDGAPHRLSDYRGKKVLLYCWSSW